MVRNLLKQPYFISFLISITILSLVISSYVFSWTLPSSTAPNSNLNSPLNVSPNNQYKIGYLAIGTSTAPQFPLDVAGVMRIGRYSSAPSGANGALYYDTTTNKFKGYQSGAWSDLGGSVTELWSISGSNIYYNSGKVGIGTSTPTYTLTVAPPTGFAYDISICKNGVCCPIWKDCDGDGKTYGNGDCDESCSTCYVGSTAYTTSPDGKDQDCDGEIDEFSPQSYYLFDSSGRTGNFGGRSGADNYCNIDADKPNGFGNAWAFISVNANDEIQDMPTTKNVNQEAAWYFKDGTATPTLAANNWTDLLDGTVANKPNSGGIDYVNYWTGSTASGALSDVCQAWTTDSSSYYGQFGFNDDTSVNWLSSNFTTCDYYDGILCAIAAGAAYK